MQSESNYQDLFVCCAPCKFGPLTFYFSCVYLKWHEFYRGKNKNERDTKEKCDHFGWVTRTISFSMVDVGNDVSI